MLVGSYKKKSIWFFSGVTLHHWWCCLTTDSPLVLKCIHKPNMIVTVYDLFDHNWKWLFFVVVFFFTKLLSLFGPLCREWPYSTWPTLQRTLGDLTSKLLPWQPFWYIQVNILRVAPSLTKNPWGSASSLEQNVFI